MTSSATWVRRYTSFTATGTDLSILFKTTGTYYFYNMQLETGKICSDWTPNPADVDDDLENATSIAQQAADKFSWIVKSGTSSSNFEITDKFMNLVSTNINLDGVVSFMNTAKGDGRKNLYSLDYSSFENVASQEDAICYAKDNGVTSVDIDSSVSYDGNKSLKISYTTANLNSNTTPLYLGSSANNYGCVKVQAGKQYILSCYVKSDSTTGMFMIDVQGHDTPDTKTGGLYLSNIDPRKLPGSSTYVMLSTDWQQAVCAIKVADNATGLYLSVVPLIWGKPTNSNVPQTFNVWVDCIMLEEVDSISNEPGTYILDKETIIDGGSIKADTVTGNQILAGSITADKISTDAITADKIVANAITAGKIATNAIKSRNYSYLSGNYSTAGTFLDLSDGKIISKNFSIDGSGNAYFKGAIESITGMIGGWDINNGYLSSGTWGTTNGMLLCPGGSGSSKSIGGSESISGWAITASDKFGVTKDGKLYASDGMFSGTINASKGIIGANGEGFYISNSGLYATYSSNVYEKSTRSFAFSKPSTNNFDFVFTYDNIDNDIVDKNNGIKESRIDYFRVNIEYSYSQTVTNSDSENNSDGDEATKDTDETETVTDSMTIDIDTSKLVLSSTNVSESGNILTYTLSYCIDYGSGYTNLDAYIQSLLSSYSSDYVLVNYSFSSNMYVLFNNVNTYASVSVKQLKYGQVFEVNENKVVAKNLEVKDSAITVINNSYQSTLSNSCLTLQSLTVNSNSYNTVGSNPSILFKNNSGNQNIALVYTDYDSVKAPSCLTLIGNQGGEYFIAPNVQVKNKLYIGPGGSNIYYAVAHKKKNLYYYTQGYHSFYVNGKGIAWIQYNGINMSKNIMFRDNQGITAYDHSNWYMLRCYDGANHTNTVALGNSHLSTSVYTTSSVWYNGSSTTKLSTTSSDKRLKEDFVDISKYENMFMDLNPITYKFHDGLYNVKGTKPLRTWGFIADQVIDSFNKNGLDWKDEELVTIDRDGEYTEEELKYVDNHTMLKMNYQNMISLNTHMIQKTRKELEQVKQEKADLEARLQAIEAKLGL